MTFDLNDMYDRAKWDAIKFNPLIADARDARDAKGDLLIDGSPDRYGVAELYIERPEQEATKRVSKEQKILKAMSFINDDEKGNSGRITKCKMLGKSVIGLSDSDIMEYLFDYAKKTNPDMIIDLYTSSNTPIRMLLIDAKEASIIYYKNGMYTFADGVILGSTDQAAVNWLADIEHKNTLKLIQSQVYSDYNPINLDEEELVEKAEAETKKPKK